MAEINKNVVISDPFYYGGKGPLDAKQTPAEVYSDLNDTSRIPLSERYVGLTVLVLNPSPTEYWLVGGTKNKNWKIKQGNVVPTKADLNAIAADACTLGLEMVVQADETNEGKVTKYWVTEFNGTTPVWSQKQYGGGSANVPVDGEDLEV